MAGGVKDHIGGRAETSDLLRDREAIIGAERKEVISSNPMRFRPGSELLGVKEEGPA